MQGGTKNVDISLIKISAQILWRLVVSWSPIMKGKAMSGEKSQ